MGKLILRKLQRREREKTERKALYVRRYRALGACYLIDLQKLSGLGLGSALLRAADSSENIEGYHDGDYRRGQASLTIYLPNC